MTRDTPVLSSQRPFPGLRPFDFRDHEFFFGREEQIYALYRLIDRSRFVAVVGSSGSGKSSLVRAGLLPLLDEETSGQGGRNWQRRVMRPGEAPITSLARLLASLAYDDDSTIAAVRQERIAFDLRRSSFGIADAISKIENLKGFSLLLVVDQFEELFRYGSGSPTGARDAIDEARSRDEATQFVQLLLEGSRASQGDIHIVVTMRSDFIGDCARFHGLPEAVSASQFLVPSLTRDQLEEVIRCPLEKIGDTIEPALVERLLNDSSDELDQLPVLQHCLLRLWERAGTDPADKARPEVVAEASTEAPRATVTSSRHLRMEHYLGIGGMSGALSRHAEEILAELSGLELAVEQTFRALAEIDREGRAIRRALPFRQLLEESGVPETDLRRVLDRFRADDCSFLVPSVSDVPVIEAATRIDVGHEALLRRWARTSGVGGSIVSSETEGGSGERLGWLRCEERDGQLYRGLLSLLDHVGTDAPTLPLGLVDERWTWWNTHPRTPAWAARYGGDFDRVQQLFEASLAALRAEDARKQREAALRARVAKITRVGAIVVSGLLIVAVVLAFLSYRQAEIAKRSYLPALRQTRSVVEKISQDLPSGAVSVRAGKDLLATIDATINDLQDIRRSPQATEIGVNILLAYANSLSNLGDFEEASKKAQLADKFADELAALDPTKRAWQVLLFGSAFRLGDAEAQQGELSGASREYRRAQAIAQRLVAEDPTTTEWRYDLSFVDGKIGDIYQSQGDFSNAIAMFETAFSISENFAAAHPADIGLRRQVATMLTKIGNALAKKPQPDLDGALQRFDTAIEILTDLAAQHPDDDVVASNLAHAYNGKAKLLSARGNYEAAISEYRADIAIQERLVDKDPGNVFRLGVLAPDYRSFADLLKSKGDVEGALELYREELEIRQQLVNKDPSNSSWLKNLEKCKANIDSLSAPDPKASLAPAPQP